MAQLRQGLQNQPDVAMSDQVLIVLATESDIYGIAGLSFLKILSRFDVRRSSKQINLLL